MKLITSSIAVVVGLAAASVQAEPMQLASLSSVDGKVLVNKGKGFVTARSGTPLAEGDRVITLNGSHAAVVYPDGCVTQVKENSLLALDKSTTCGKEAVKTGGTQQPLQYAQAIGGTTTDAGAGGAGGGAGGAGLGAGLTASPFIVTGSVLLIGVGIHKAGGSNNAISDQ